MFGLFTNRKLRQARAAAEDIYKSLHRNRLYAQDVLKPKDLDNLRQLEARYPEAARTKDLAVVEQWNRDADKTSGRVFPASSWDAVRENVEVFLVAIVVALAIRPYFLQPFKIPTGSMQPTLYGIQSAAAREPAPALPVRMLEMVFLGRTHIYLKTDEGGTLTAMTPGRIGIWFEYTTLVIGGHTHRVWSNMGALQQMGLKIGRELAPGEEVLNFVQDTGDQVFVNKMAYNFRKPQRGEVFIFKTSGISYIEDMLRWQGQEGSQYYIKRCVGVPGDELRIDEPYLYVNGSIVREPKAFERIYSRQDGYRGYTSTPSGLTYLRTPSDPYRVPANRYWAMGDNSYNSLDSRFWGSVPRESLVGTGFFVYWPFTHRWGSIR